MNSSFTPNDDNKNLLKEFSKDLTQLALENKLEPVIGKEDEIRRLTRILSRKTKNNPVLIGKPGIGKTAIVEGLAKKIIEKNVPENLKKKKILELDIASMLAGTQYRGSFEKRIKKILKQIEDKNDEIIIFIDEIHMIVGAGQTEESNISIANILKPSMARGMIHLIGATTNEEYRKYIEKDSALERRMQKILVTEPTIKETITILRGIKERFETFHKVQIQDDALISAVKLSERYITDRFLPDKAIDLIDEAAATIKTIINSEPEPLQKIKQKIFELEVEKAALSQDKKKFLEIDKIEKQLKTLHKESENMNYIWRENKKKLAMISQLKEKIKNYKLELIKMQNEGNFSKASELSYGVIPKLKEELIELEIKMQNNTNDLFVEVVSENEIAKIVSSWTHIPVSKLIETQKEKILNLANNLKKSIIGQNKAINLINDVILRSKANINDPNKPIGSFIFMGPTGVGKTELSKVLAKNLFDNGKNLIRVDMSEYSEKHNVSRLIGSPPGYAGYEQAGQLSEQVRINPYSIILFDEIDKAHPSVLDILLQILDNGILTDGQGKTINFKNTIIIMTTNAGVNNNFEEDDYKMGRKVLEKYFKTEFLNRVDEIVVFEQLKNQSLKKIIQLELNYLSKRVLENRKIILVFDETVEDEILHKLNNKKYGARQIKRTIQNYIESELASKLIKEEFSEGSTIISKTNLGKLVFEEKKPN